MSGGLSDDGLQGQTHYGTLVAHVPGWQILHKENSHSVESFHWRSVAGAGLSVRTREFDLLLSMQERKKTTANAKCNVAKSF